MPNTMPTFQHCKLELALEAQSPMIHFQAGTAGVTLRASEVKPKLDRFLLAKLREKGGFDSVSALKADDTYGKLFASKDHDALQYKMQLFCKKAPTHYPFSFFQQDKRNRGYDIYYGNTGEKDKSKLKELVFSDPTLTIICMNATLRALIEEHIVAFFLVTNFGTMQGKGFGSFLPVCCGYDTNLQKAQAKEVSLALKNSYGASKCYAMRFSPSPEGDISEYCVGLFKEIKQFYQILKSGYNINNKYARSYIYDYMHSKGIGNEKRWMKENRMVPVIGRLPAEAPRESERGYRYVRAMLGIGERVKYIRVMGNPQDTLDTTIESAPDEDGNKLFDRISSPIFFKIVRNTVFIIAKEVPKETYDQTFYFSGQTDIGEPVVREAIQTPKHNEFDIQELLGGYVPYYNNELRQKIGNMNQYKLVAEV